MRVLFVTTCLPPESIGGAESYAIQLSAALSSFGVEVTLLGRDAPGPTPVTADLAGVRVIRLASWGHRYFGYLAALSSWLRRHGSEYDVIQFFDMNHVSGIGLLATNNLRAPRLLRDEGQVVWSDARLEDTGLRGLAALSRRGLQSADWVVYVSRSEREALREAGFEDARLRYLPNGIDSQQFPKTGVPCSRQIVCPARLRAEKNHEGLLRTFARVRDRVPDARLALAGDGTLRERLARTAESLGLRDSVSFLGHVSDMRSLYAQSRLCVLLSSAEGPALGVLEAQCSGRPCVVSAVGGLVDSVEHGRSGLVVSPGDESAAADAITRLLLDDDLAESMGRAAAERVRRHFDFTVVSRQYEDLLMQVANAARVGVRSR